MSDFPKKWTQTDENTMIADTPVVLPPPMPAPVPPAPLADVPTPNDVGNMTKGADGIYRSNPGWEKTIASVHFNLPALGYGQNFRVVVKRKQKYPYTGTLNIKVFRVWKGKVGGYPNWYIGRQVDGSNVLYTEKVIPLTGSSRFYLTYPPPADTWRKETWEWKANSGLGAKDGKLKLTIDDKVIFETQNWQTDSVESPGVPNDVYIQDDVSNAWLPVGSTVEYEIIEVKTWK